MTGPNHPKRSLVDEQPLEAGREGMRGKILVRVGVFGRIEARGEGHKLVTERLQGLDDVVLADQIGELGLIVAEAPDEFVEIHPVERAR